jgi:hypothetical protein
MTLTSDDRLWATRAFIYQRFVETARPPTVAETAAHFHSAPEETTALYRELDARHALFLDPGTLNIRIANPFSAVPTPFLVHAHGQTYYANCAWDSLGISAALHSEARIETEYAEDHAPLALTVQNGAVTHPGGVAHVLVPFQRWYEDMVFT